jgi:hypothetical protein
MLCGEAAQQMRRADFRLMNLRALARKQLKARHRGDKGHLWPDSARYFLAVVGDSNRFCFFPHEL